jgi:N-acyl homoserine lactone hydrolase
MTPSTITPVFVADQSVEGEQMPVYVHVIDHPAARVLVDTGMIASVLRSEGHR